MRRTVLEYKSFDDPFGALVSALRRYSLSGSVLISIEQIFSENKIFQENLLIDDGHSQIRITDIDFDKYPFFKKTFSTIGIPYFYLNKKWYSVDEDPDYAEDLITKMNKEKNV